MTFDPTSPGMSDTAVYPFDSIIPDFFEDGSAGVEIVMKYREFYAYIRRVRFIFSYYTRLNKISMVTNASMLTYPNGKVWDGIELAKDLAKVQRNVANLVERKGYSVLGPASCAIAKKAIDKIKFGFKISESAGISLEYIILTQGTSGKEEKFDFNFSQLDTTDSTDCKWTAHGLISNVSSGSPFKSKTISNYLMNLKNMDL